MLLDLVPPDEVGKYFGFYGLSGKMAAFGSLIFGAVADGFGYRAALIWPIAAMTIGLLCIMRIRTAGEIMHPVPNVE